MTKAGCCESKKMAEAATPGPWSYCKDNLPCLIEAGVYSKGIRILSAIAPLQALRSHRDSNAKFVANVRTAHPDALEMLEQSMHLLQHGLEGWSSDDLAAVESLVDEWNSTKS